MELKSFKEFLREEYLVLESIRHLDDRVFRPFLDGKYDMTPAELKAWRNRQSLIKEDDDKYWLENDAEVKLIETYQKDPHSPEGREALEKLIKNKIPYVKSKVGKYIAAHPEFVSEKSDMEQEALIALTNAIEKFDGGSGNIFSAFANGYIAGTLINHDNPQRQKSSVNGKGDSYGRNAVSVFSIDATPKSGEAGDYADKETSLAEKLEDPNQRRPWDESPEELAEHAAILHDWYETLPEQEKIAMKMYFPPYSDMKPATLEEIGQAIGGMTKMGVQKLITRTIIKLRKLAEQAGFVEPGDTDSDPEFYEKLVKIARGKEK